MYMVAEIEVRGWVQGGVIVKHVQVADSVAGCDRHTRPLPLQLQLAPDGRLASGSLT